jgi:hypothetical protein
MLPRRSHETFGMSGEKANYRRLSDGRGLRAGCPEQTNGLGVDRQRCPLRFALCLRRLPKFPISPGPFRVTLRRPSGHELRAKGGPSLRNLVPGQMSPVDTEIALEIVEIVATPPKGGFPRTQLHRP